MSTPHARFTDLSQIVTAGEWRRAARDILVKAGAAPQEAGWMLQDVTGSTVPEGALDPGHRATLGAMVQRRCAGEPLQYILGHTDFMDLSFKTSPAALIPRPETEGLVERVLSRLPAPATGWVADIGTGTGCILLSLLHARPGLRGIGTDISSAALSLAQENARRLGLEERVVWFKGDGLEPLRDRQALLAVVSNPPYVSLEEKDALPREVVDFEPRGALFSSDHGLGHIKSLVSLAPALLLPGALLALEIGETQGEAVRGLLEPGPWGTVHLEKDLAGRMRYALAVKA